MNSLRLCTFAMLTGSIALLSVGCKGAPGIPGPQAQRPSEVMNADVLYSQNCAACHGTRGKEGAAVSLANPVYLAYAGEARIEQIAANGVPGTLMPAFAKSKGGELTDQQIGVIAQGMEAAWGRADASGGQKLPPYSGTGAGNAADGQKAFQTFCARCHGADGGGLRNGGTAAGSIVDPAYLALISDQGLRSLIVAGQPAQGMPDWKSDVTGAGARAMTDQEITDVVAWLVSHRISAPGQPYAHAAD
jgi:cytochrome c oxidase cbb3-type subunit 3/ubiquinol-cytochrome c reductase cytochrome c subunit